MEKPEKIKTHADGCRHYRYPNSCDCGMDDFNQGLTAGLAYSSGEIEELKELHMVGLGNLMMEIKLKDERIKGIVEVYEKIERVINEGMDLEAALRLFNDDLWQAIKAFAEREKK